jgi:hypothetical protein
LLPLLLLLGHLLLCECCSQLRHLSTRYTQLTLLLLLPGLCCGTGGALQALSRQCSPQL